MNKWNINKYIENIKNQVKPSDKTLKLSVYPLLSNLEHCRNLEYVNNLTKFYKKVEVIEDETLDKDVIKANGQVFNLNSFLVEATVDVLSDKRGIDNKTLNLNLCIEDIKLRKLFLNDERVLDNFKNINISDNPIDDGQIDVFITQSKQRDNFSINNYKDFCWIIDLGYITNLDIRNNNALSISTESWNEAKLSKVKDLVFVNHPDGIYELSLYEFYKKLAAE